MRLFVLLALLFCMASNGNAQVKKKKDTVLFGGWWIGSGEKPKLAAPVLRDPEKKKEVQPKQTLCFDTKFFVTGVVQGNAINCCFVVNTESGLTGSVPLYDPTCKCKFNNLDDPRFQFLLTTKKGVEFRYYNREEKKARERVSQIRHYVTTGNTHRDQLDELIEQKRIFLKEGSYRELLNGAVKAREYVTDDGKSSVFLAGNNYPKELTIKDGLGAYGLGYIITNAGDYLVLAHTRGSQFNMAIREIVTLAASSNCFATEAFVPVESEVVPKAIDDASDRERKLEEKLQKDQLSSSPCAPKKAEATAYKLKATKKEKETLGKLQHNKIRSSSESDMYKLAAMYNPITPYAVERRELEHKLCVLEEDMAKGRISNKQMAGASRTKQCWENKIAIYKRLEEQWNKIETKYKNDPGLLNKARGEFQRDQLLPGIKEAHCKP